MKMDKIVVAIPSYNRPATLRTILRRLLNFEIVNKIVVVADASSQETLRSYKEVLSEHCEKIVAELNLGYRGSTKTRNALLEMVTKNVDEAKYILLLDDDFLLSSSEVLQRMIGDLEMLDDVGIAGGRIVNIEKSKIDPEFSLNVPKKVADCLTKLSGWLFCTNKHEISYGKGTTPFMLVRRNVLDKIRYDENYQGTGYREESDLHRQAFRLGFRILSDDRAYVYHLPTEEGGNRDLRGIHQRIYWKARNHTYFLLKWNGHRLGLWYMFTGAVLLTVYRPLCFCKILLGLQQGYKLWKSHKQSA